MASTHDMWIGETPASKIGLVSADSHVNEPRDLWSANLPPSLRTQAMAGTVAAPMVTPPGYATQQLAGGWDTAALAPLGKEIVPVDHPRLPA